MCLGKKSGIFWCIVCPSTLFRSRAIALFIIWRWTTGVYPEYIPSVIIGRIWFPGFRKALTVFKTGVRITV